jgi:hypothetical protein
MARNGGPRGAQIAGHHYSFRPRQPPRFQAGGLSLIPDLKRAFETRGERVVSTCQLVDSVAVAALGHPHPRAR